MKDKTVQEYLKEMTPEMILDAMSDPYFTDDKILNEFLNAFFRLKDAKAAVNPEKAPGMFFDVVSVEPGEPAFFKYVDNTGVGHTNLFQGMEIPAIAGMYFSQYVPEEEIPNVLYEIIYALAYKNLHEYLRNRYLIYDWMDREELEQVARPFYHPETSFMNCPPDLAVRYEYKMRFGERYSLMKLVNESTFDKIDCERLYRDNPPRMRMLVRAFDNLDGTKRDWFDLGKANGRQIVIEVKDSHREDMPEETLVYVLTEKGDVIALSEFRFKELVTMPVWVKPSKKVFTEADVLGYVLTAIAYPKRMERKMEEAM